MKRVLIILSGVVLILLTSPIFGRIYQFFISQVESIFVVSQEFVDIFIGLPLSYLFFLPLLFTAFGGAKKYWWIGIGLIPALAFELYFDLAHIYFPLALGLVGWVIGFGLSRILVLSRRAP